ncbi:prenyltransferase/squalene oxidase repeat-containing protein [Streptomyces sp. NPDC004237]|uniref:prenyltransferase/squalene oxidase repeat-containing protein n=1 Tax=Streptomyces sp. NPDC004237 TaxID=3154455 RepID=UPI0033B3C3F3
MIRQSSPSGHGAVPRTREPFASQALRLVTAVDRDPWGSVGPSAYETARVISFAPWLPDHERRLAWLRNVQRDDGSWGEGPSPYRLLPTLSAVEAVLSVLRHETASPDSRAELEAAASTGLAALRDLPQDGPWPDTAAIEILVPDLTAQINEHLGQPFIGVLPQLGGWSRGARLAVPAGFDDALPTQVGERCRSNGVLPAKLHHTLEGIARSAPLASVDLTGGLVGSSPAATAAWAAVASAPARQPAVTQLTAVAQRYNGLFPEAAPITVFERLWVAAGLAGPGLPDTCLPTIRAWASQTYDPAGVRGAPGLLPDADDTAMMILVSALVGQPRAPDALSVFDAGTHYDCYVGEDTGSVTANAHALQALGRYLMCRPEGSRNHRLRMVMAQDWLVERQSPDGWWTDKWHASPYYATERCVTALCGGDGPRAADAVRRAADWVLATQDADGSWGIWGGTAEETAYAVKILLRAPARKAPARTRDALDRAVPVLTAAASEPVLQGPALWHDKTLYAPYAMVQAEVLAALQLLRTRGR